MNTTTYTVEVYKADARKRGGKRLFSKEDFQAGSKVLLVHAIQLTYPESEGYTFNIHETFVTRRNIMTGKDFTERYDTPSYCSPSSESYWCM
jgi:hypothetical protein